MKNKKAISMFMATVITSFSFFPLASHANGSDEYIELNIKDNNFIEQFAEEGEIILSISDQEYLQMLESAGYDITAIFTQQELDEINSPFKPPSYGKTEVVKIRDGYYKIYLSSAVMGTVKTVGAGAIGFLFGSVMGPAGAVIAAAIVENGYDTDRGAVFSWRKSNGGWKLTYLGGQ